MDYVQPLTAVVLLYPWVWDLLSADPHAFAGPNIGIHYAVHLQDKWYSTDS